MLEWKSLCPANDETGSFQVREQTTVYFTHDLRSGPVGIFWALARKSVDVRGKTSHDRYQTHDQLGSKMSPRRRWIPLRDCGPEFLNPLFLINVAVEAALKRSMQCTLIAFGCCVLLIGKSICTVPTTGPLLRMKHQSNDGALVRRCRQEQ